MGLFGLEFIGFDILYVWFDSFVSLGLKQEDLVLEPSSSASESVKIASKTAIDVEGAVLYRTQNKYQDGQIISFEATLLSELHFLAQYKNLPRFFLQEKKST